MTTELPHRFAPRPYQKALMKAILGDGFKRAVCVWHRRAGKDKTFLNILVAQAMSVMGNYAYYFPTATLGRKALWDNIDARSGMRVVDHIPSELLSKMNEQQMKITLVNGSTIQVLGSDNLDVVGGNHIGVIFSESAQQNPLAWDYIRPILAENKGWALFNGTPRGKNWFYRLYHMAKKNEDWFSQLLTISDTGALTQEDVDAERKAGMREELVQQEFYCDWTIGVPGAIYAKYVEQARQERRVGPFPFAGIAPVYTSWDLGAPRNTVVWYFQVVGRKIVVIDLDMDKDETLIERAARMRSKPYPYAKHFLPHDGDQKERSGQTAANQLREGGLENVVTVPRTLDIWWGVNHLQQLFSALEFNEDKCENGLAGLEAYHVKVDEEGKKVYDEPVHDWSSHIADAIRTMAEAWAHGLFKFSGAGYTEKDAAYKDDRVKAKRRGLRTIRLGG